MTDLLTRLEKATEGSRELDAEIYEDLTGKHIEPLEAVSGETILWEPMHDVPHYTASLDAKLPWENIVRTWRSEGYWHAEHLNEDSYTFFAGRAKTEVLARRIAALRARERAKETEEQSDG